MGGCATKPLVLKDETEGPSPVEKATGVAEPAKAEEAGSGEAQKDADKSEEADGQKSLCNLIKEKEDEEAATAAGEEEQKEENEKTSTDEVESKPEASEVNTEAAVVEEKQQ